MTKLVKKRTDIDYVRNETRWWWLKWLRNELVLTKQEMKQSG